MPAWLPLAILLVALAALIAISVFLGYIVTKIAKLFEVKHNYPDDSLPPVGWWARCAYTGHFHRIYAHDLLSNEKMALTCDNTGYWGAYDYHWTEWYQYPPEGYSNDY